MGEDREEDQQRPQDGDMGGFPTRSLPDSPQELGTQIGRYKLLSVLGEGGFGIVYLAEQKQPVRRQVALKVIKPGMDSKQVIARFEAERQALALLDHPNIARVFDAGATEKGRPYFVMEIVKGLPITEYCDQHSLSIEERLELFRQVCGAVQHAHYKGIIHRDLKPSNILVPVRGDKPVPMIIDFGVAKAISQPLTERTLFTEQGQFIGTPEYMSPEQAGITIVDIDTRSDIYSLGIVLYELLTGTLPFSRHELEQAGFAEIQRIIRETDPPRPSTRLSGLGEDATKIAEKRHTEVRALTKRLHNELEWIPLKAMRKEPDRRYTSAAELADDVQNYLNGDPLIAGPESSAYRTRKFVRKHRRHLTYAAILLVVIVLAVALIRVEVRRQKEQKAIGAIKLDLKKREQKQLFEEQMSDVDRLYAEGEYEQALSQLDTILESQEVEPRARLLYAKLLFEMGRTKDAVAKAEGLLSESPEIAGAAHSLLARIYIGRDHAKAMEHKKKCEELLPESPEAYWLRAATSGTFGEGVEWLEKALQLDPEHYPSHRALALTYYAMRDFKSLEREAYAMTTMSMRKNDPLCYSLMAIALRESGSPTDAVGYHDKAIEISPDDSGLYDQRRQTYMRMGDYEKALSDAETCIRLQPREAIHRFHRFCALVGLGRYDEAKAKYKEVFGSGSANREYFQNESMKYVFDALSTGQKLNLPDSGSQDAAFWPMYQACVFYRELEAKAKLTQGRGWQVSWSPDGRELAYSRDLTKSLCVEISNIESRKSRVLTAPGKDPSWSTDGQYIAFVREGQYGTFDTIIVGTEAESRGQVEEEEVWLIRPTGEDLKFLCKGGYPSWSRDSKRVYFHSRQDFYLYSVSIEDVNAQPQRVIHCPSTYYPVVSPDEKRVAYVWKYPERNVLVIAELPTGSSVSYWEVPTNQGWDFIAWSPDGRQLSIGGYGDVGLWIYDLNTRTGSSVLGGQVVRAAWSPDGSRMALELRRPTDYIWIAELKPGLSTAEALGPSRTIDEHREYLTQRWESALAAGSLGTDFSEGDLVAWWAFNEASGKVVPDYAGNGLNARLIGTARIVEDPVRGNVLSLDGSGYAHCGYDSAFDITASVTVAAWVRVSEFNKQWQAIVTKGDNAWRLHRNSTTRSTEFACTGANVEDDNYGCLKGTIDVNDGKWHHIVGVYDGKSVHLYIDGVVDVTKKAWGFVNTNNFPLLIGANAEKEGRNWNGLIDDVRIYSRALSEKELTVLCEAERSGTAARLGVAADSQAWLPHPSDGARNTTVSADFQLTWIPAADVVEQSVYFGTDAESLALLQTLGRDNSIEPPELKNGQDYFWRIDGIKSDGSKLEGPPWKFHTGGPIVCSWEFDEAKAGTVVDSSGNSLDGKLKGDAHVVLDPAMGHVLSLDGDGDYVDFGNDPAFDITDSITITAWIKINTFDAYCQAIVTKGDTAWRVQRARESSSIEFACSGLVLPKADYDTNFWGRLEGRKSVEDGGWHHVAGVYDGVEIRLYVDGVLDNAREAQGTINTNDYPVHVGANADETVKGGMRYWKGFIDGVHMYSCALDQTQIRVLVSETGRGRPSVPNPSDGKCLGKTVGPVQLSWQPGKDATAYKVYFGSAKESLSLLKRVKEANSVQSPKLHKPHSYFWRADAERLDGSTVTGDLWSFSTGGIVGSWNFDEDEGQIANDSSAFNNTGKLVGGARIILDPERGKVLTLDGENDYVDCGNNPIFDITSQVTVAAWIKLSATGVDQKIANNQDDNTGGYKMGVYTNNKVEFEIRTATGTAILNRGVAGGRALSQGVWHHIAAVYSQGDYIRTYVDGILDRELLTTEIVGASSGALRIGRDWTNSLFWDGLIDDVRIYSYALSEKEIRELYEETVQKLDVPDPGGKPDRESPAQVSVPSTAQKQE